MARHSSRMPARSGRGVDSLIVGSPARPVPPVVSSALASSWRARVRTASAAILTSRASGAKSGSSGRTPRFMRSRASTSRIAIRSPSDAPRRASRVVLGSSLKCPLPSPGAKGPQDARRLALDELLGRLELVAQLPLRGGLVLEPDCETLDLLGQVGNPRVGRIKRLFLFFQVLHMLRVAPDRFLRRAQVLAWIRHRPRALLIRWPVI